jgi:cholesterol transport system auxiliary component
VLLASLPVGGCSGLLHSTAKPEQIYFLRAPSAPAPGATGSDAAAPATATAGAHAPASLRVGRPAAGPGLDTSHIMLVQADRRMNFYTGSRWPAPAPELIEALAVQTLRASGNWASVEDPASPFPSGYLLQLHVRRFEAEYTDGGAPPVVHVVLDCVLGRREGRDVLATFTASGSAPAAANRLGEVVAAFEQAAGTALTALAQQAALIARGDTQRAAQNAETPVPSITR